MDEFGVNSIYQNKEKSGSESTLQMRLGSRADDGIVPSKMRESSQDDGLFLYSSCISAHLAHSSGLGQLHQLCV
jgi:hypothetical protein